MLREGISWAMQPDGRALPVSPRYQISAMPMNSGSLS